MACIGYLSRPTFLLTLYRGRCCCEPRTAAAAPRPRARRAREREGPHDHGCKLRGRHARGGSTILREASAPRLGFLLVFTSTARVVQRYSCKAYGSTVVTQAPHSWYKWRRTSRATSATTCTSSTTRRASRTCHFLLPSFRVLPRRPYLHVLVTSVRGRARSATRG